MEQLKEIFYAIEPTVWTLVGVLLLWLIGKLLAKMSQDAQYAEICAALREGVDKAQEEFVTWRKRAAEDGKLTPAERKEAMQIAYNHAKSILTGPAGKAFATWSIDKIQSIIKQYVEKKKAAENKTIVVESKNVDNNSTSANTPPVA